MKKVGTEKGDKGDREEFDSVSTAPLYHLTSAEISACVIISQLPAATSRRDNIVKLIFATTSIFHFISAVLYRATDFPTSSSRKGNQPIKKQAERKSWGGVIERCWSTKSGLLKYTVAVFHERVFRYK